MAAITTAAIGAGTAIYSASQSSKQAKKAGKQNQAAIDAADPYAPYRDDAAQRLNALIADPDSITETATYKARQKAAERTMASQGYSGSGNAIMASTDAAAQSYQQEFQNLAALSGAVDGLGNATSAYGAGQAAQMNANDNKLSAWAGVGNNLTNLANTVFNKPVTPAASGGK